MAWLAQSSSYTNQQLLVYVVIIIILTVVALLLFLDYLGTFDVQGNPLKTIGNYFSLMSAPVIAYDDPAFAGVVSYLYPGQNTKVGKISSLKVASGYKVTLYSNKGVAPTVLGKGDYTQLGEGYNDASILAVVELNPNDVAVGAAVTAPAAPAPPVAEKTA